jgi:serine/threonine-protein kinase RsbW
MVIASDLKAVRQVEGRLLKQVAGHGYSEAAVFAIKLAVEEGLTNAIRHGNGGDRTKEVEIVFEVDDQCAVITITDQGTGFNPSTLPDPTADENLEKPGGRGIMLMRAYMDELTFNERGNQIRMVKRNS